MSSLVLLSAFLEPQKRQDIMSVLRNVHIGPIAKIEALAIQGDTMYPGWNHSSHRLVINWQPANILNRDLFSLVIHGDARLTIQCFSLRDSMIERGIAPLTIIVSCVCGQIECQPVIRIGEVGSPLRKAKLNFMPLCFVIVT